MSKPTKSKRTANQPIPYKNYKIELLNIFSHNFNTEEFRTFCFGLNVDYDHLPGEELQSRARELLLRSMRYGNLDEVVELGKHQRPDISWPELPPVETQKMDYKRFQVNTKTEIIINTSDKTSRIRLLAAIFYGVLGAIIAYFILGPILAYWIELVNHGGRVELPISGETVKNLPWFLIGGAFGAISGYLNPELDWLNSQ